MKRNFYSIVSLCVLLIFFGREGKAEINRLTIPSSSLEIPAAATSFISNPANNSITAAAPSLKVTANVASGATRYTIELNTTPDFSGTSIIRTSSIDNQRTLTFTGLAYSTTYYGRVKTNASELYGKITKFSTRAEQFPEIEQPLASSSENNPVVLKVVVSTVSQAKRYVVELNKNSDFSGTSLSLSSGTDNQNTFLFKNLEYATTYYVRAKSDVSTTFGPSIYFETREKISQKRIWGLASAGGANGFGSIFSLSIDSATFTKHMDYIPTSEYPNAYARGTLVSTDDGGFLGSSECGNSTCGDGEVFYVSPQGEYQLRYSLGIHMGSLALASDNNLFVVDDWINMFRGGIWKLDASESRPYELSDIVFRFKSNSQGLNPKESLLELPDGYLYGVAPSGGLGNSGTIFKIKLDGTGFQVIHHFDHTSTGAFPEGSLTLGADGYLYGTTRMGGNFDSGVLFKILPNGTGYNKLYNFNGVNGKFPYCKVLVSGDVVYGTTYAGGTSDQGVVFRIKTDGTAYNKLTDFSGVNGANPSGGPIIDEDGTLYGMTSRGGNNDMGVIFKIDADGLYDKFYDFSEESGGMPDGELLLVEDFFTGTLSAMASAKEVSVGISPNPFTDTFTAEISSADDQEVHFVLTDLNGTIVHQSSGFTNTTNSLGDDLRRGIYVLKIIKGDEVSLHRVVKK
jgi:uncharacterized repeat protein (TIGR03803 family)